MRGQAIIRPAPLTAVLFIQRLFIPDLYILNLCTRSPYILNPYIRLPPITAAQVITARPAMAAHQFLLILGVADYTIAGFQTEDSRTDGLAIEVFPTGAL